MKTVFVKYSRWEDSGHALLDDVFVKKSKIVKVEDLTDLNKKFKKYTIDDVKVLESIDANGNTHIHFEENPFADEGAE